MKILSLFLLLCGCSSVASVSTCSQVWQWTDKDQEDIASEMKFLDGLAQYKEYAREVYSSTPPSINPNSPAVELSAAILTLPDLSKVNTALLDYESLRKQAFACNRIK